MKKYQINRSVQERNEKSALFTGCTLEDNPAGQEYVSDIFDTLEEAKAEFTKYETMVYDNGKFILVEEFQIVAGEYDEEDDCLMEHGEIEITEMPSEFIKKEGQYLI